MKSFAEIGRDIRSYAQAATALYILEKEASNRVLKVSLAQQKINYYNTKEKKTFMDLIFDLLNTEGEKILKEEEYVATLEGDTAYQVKAKKIINPETFKQEVVVTVTKILSEDKQKKFGLREVDYPQIVVRKDDAIKYQVIINGKEVFNDESPKPAPLQLRVINKFSDALIGGQIQQLAIMGTGTGKSWVIAGITHANNGRGIIVVPNDALADEMMHEAIIKLHGPFARDAVHTSKEYATVDEFAEALKIVPQMILIADDPLFNEKALLIQNQIVLMDESHQHTFEKRSVETLEYINNHNALLALTGTPTSKLKNIIGRDTLVDVNVRSVMDRGGLRQNCRKTDTNVLSTDLISTAIMGYFGRDEYPMRGIGVMSVDNIIELMSGEPSMSEEDAIDMAIEKNRHRGLYQKNFLFTGSDRLRRDWLQAYQDIADGNYPNEIILASKIQQARRDAEINARTAIMQELHPDEDADKLYRMAEARVGRGSKVNLVKEVQDAQKLQIAMSVNTHALNLLYPKIPARDFEAMQRQGTLDKYIVTLAMKPKNLADIVYDDIAKGLPNSQREKYLAKVMGVVQRIHANQNNPDVLCKIEDINLKELQARYTASATVGSSIQNRTTDEESAAILDGLRCGLVMHVASDKYYTTGISISSVLGVQQIVSSVDDSLNNAVDAPQLHGRNIRAKDLAAFNQQIVSNQVPEDQYVKLDDIYAEDSAKKMDKFFAVEKEKENRYEFFSKLKDKYEKNEKDDETLDRKPRPLK